MKGERRKVKGERGKGKGERRKEKGERRKVKGERRKEIWNLRIIGRRCRSHYDAYRETKLSWN